MLDLKALREEPERARAALERRGDPEVLALLDRILALDVDRRDLIGEVEELKAERNRVSREVGQRKRAGEDASELIEGMREVVERIRDLDGRLAEVEGALEDALLALPNLPDGRVPPGDEEAKVVVHEWGEPASGPGSGQASEPASGPTSGPGSGQASGEAAEAPAPHWDLVAAHGSPDGPGAGAFAPAGVPLVDLERGAKVAGSGFPLFLGLGARLARGLVSFMLDLHAREHGYLEVSPPFLVSRDSMTGTGHLPKFQDDAYRTEPDDLFLVPTAEVPLTNLHRDEILDGGLLPLAYVAYTPCFRREAGAAGRDTRGLLRVHQFDKVELVRLARPEDSADELETLTRHAEVVLERLELPYRRVLLPAGDLGFANAITYDLEVWSAGVGEWLEVSSCSCYADYQARRANIRFRPGPGAKPEFVHTLNGSGVALARTIVALLENGHELDGGIRLPAALGPYLGFERIPPLP